MDWLLFGLRKKKVNKSNAFPYLLFHLLTAVCHWVVYDIIF